MIDRVEGPIYRNKARFSTSTYYIAPKAHQKKYRRNDTPRDEKILSLEVDKLVEIE